MSSYGSSPSFLAPDSTYGRPRHLQHDVPEPGWRIGPEAGNADSDMPPEGLPVASERQVVRADALGSNERQGKLLDLPLNISRCSLRALHQHAALQFFSLRSGMFQFQSQRSKIV